MSLYVEGDVPYVANGNCSNGGMGFGGNGWGDLAALIVVAGLFGWGNGGFGFGGGYGGACATQADLAAGFNNSAVLSSLNDIKLGQAQAINYNNQGFSGLNATINAGFSGVDNAICTLGYQNQAGFNALSTQIAQCCCDTRAAIADVKYANERNTCDIIRAGQDNTRAILDYLTTEKISSLQAENSGLKAQISNDKQSAYLISQLREPCPIPAYLTPNPNCCYNYGVYPVNSGCCGASVQ
ncbi:MAG: hypothetical protein IKB02_05910 [Clostridia bacterium]|nr:hypothetical protein [Clostridia bacterium]